MHSADFVCLIAQFASASSVCNFDCLPHEIVSFIVRDLSTSSNLRLTSKGFKQLATVSLNREYSRRYIENENDFRSELNNSLENPRLQIRLNLGEDFVEYMTSADFRAKVDALGQSWSDVERLDLAYTRVQDIGALRTLKNLKTLRLSYTLVEDISPLASLKELQMLSLFRSQVRDLSPLAGRRDLHIIF